ncbi:hypothetical protein AM1_A0037 (plasmid) [Acaryochloris marina MBIC11017]|uniref:Uncharacterized protein n=1 Tax=Acaryochloris marina (strain MBIC 11017) TaxID=329726 RepID=A8ZK46_ACAM1|nr:hypothetical protein AM1_A0037 [Acaryochloris marina MBIC11017]
MFEKERLMILIKSDLKSVFSINKDLLFQMNRNVTLNL